MVCGGTAVTQAMVDIVRARRRHPAGRFRRTDRASYSRGVSWLRASRKIVDPDNVAWDVYVTRVRDEPLTGPFRRVRARFGLTRRIEAITDWPRPRALVWEVQGAPGTLLLDEIARGLALGKVVFPAGTKYLGERR
jgi:hypothetical protein